MYFWWRAGSDGRWRRETVKGDRGNLLQAASGERHSLLLLSRGSVHACGDNSRGQLGQKSCQSKEQPELIKALESMCFNSVSCGKEHSLALCHKGRVFAWGAGSEGQLGIEPSTEECEGITFIPGKITTFNDIKIIQVSCGDYHSMALSEGGQVFSWGMNKYGQLGLGKESSQGLPQQVKSLLGIPVAQVAAGGTHSFALSLSGTSFGWGRNNKGQLALSGNEIPGQSCKPCSIEALMNLCVVSISCGHEHTAVLTKEGKVFTFGDNSFGQLGHSPTAAKTGPKPVEGIDGLVSQIDCGSNHTLAYVYTTGQVVSFGRGPSHTSNPTHPNAPTENSDISCLISSKDLRGAKVKHIFAGTHANFVSTHQKCSTDVPKNTLPKIKQINQSLVEKWLRRRKCAELKKAERGLLRIDNIPDTLIDEEDADINQKFFLLTSEIRTIFSSAACLTASFLKKRGSGEVISTDVDLEMARDTFQKLSKKKWISSMIMTCLRENLLRDLPCCSLHREAFSIFLLLPECPVMHDPDNWLTLVVPFAKTVCKMSSQSFEVLEQCWASLQDSYLNTLVQMLKTAIVSQLKHLTETDQSHCNVKYLLKVMKNVHKVNNKVKCRLPENTFYITELSNSSNFDEGRENLLLRNHMKPEESFSPTIFSEFPFVFNLQYKIKLLKADSNPRRMDEQGILEFTPSPQCFLEVRRNHLVEDALCQLNQLKDTDLCKELTIAFDNEIDYHSEGVKSEFFHCIFEEMTKAEYRMFIYPEEGSYMWFPVNAKFPKKNYYLFGILCGLSLFHLIVVNIPFPLALYKKLLGLNPSLEDLKELSPTWGNLQEILNYDADDLEMNFSIHWDQNKVDLIPGGHSILVDQTNKNDYISKCVNYIFNTSVKTIYKEFQRGFYKVCSKRILRYFQPEELMTTMVGNTDFDWQQLEKDSIYGPGYDKSHHTIQMFWEAFHQLTSEEKRKFIFFLTGNDRLHVKGIKKMRIQFCCLETLSEDDYPKAVTCHNILVLPKYSTIEKVKEALQVTIKNNKGFTSYLGL